MKRNFEIVELGTTYDLPKYRVVDKLGLCLVKTLEENDDFAYNQTISFVRGDKTDEGVIIPRVDGILHEQLLAMMIEDMRYKNTLVPDRHTSIAITHLEDALFRLEERTKERQAKNVDVTYTK